jgi:hypothetical protein
LFRQRRVSYGRKSPRRQSSSFLGDGPSLRRSES